MIFLQHETLKKLKSKSSVKIAILVATLEKRQRGAVAVARAGRFH